jgi:hypothetical protein
MPNRHRRAVASGGPTTYWGESRPECREALLFLR